MSSAFTSLRWRLGATLSVSLIALLAITLGSAYYLLRQHTLRTGEAEQLRQTQVIASGLDDVLASVESRADELALQIYTARPNAEQLTAMLKAKVLFDSETASVSALLEPENPIRSDGRYGSVVSYGGTGLAVTDFMDSQSGYFINYQYWKKPWYLDTLAKEQGWWSDPFFNDAAGGQDTITFDYPLRDQGRTFGMLGVSIPVDRLTEIALSLGLNKVGGGRYVLADGKGKLLLIWDPTLERAYDLSQAARRTGSATLTWLAATKSDTPMQVVALSDAKLGRERLAFVPLPRLGWRIASVVSEQHLLAELHTLLIRVAWLTLACIALVIPFIWFFTKRLIGPIALLANNAERIARGESNPLAVLSGNTSEFNRLSNAILSIRSSLQAQTDRAQKQAEQLRINDAQWQHGQLLQRALLSSDRVFFGPRLQCEIGGQVRCRGQTANTCYAFIATAPGVIQFFIASIPSHGLAPALQLARISGVLPVVMRYAESPGDLLRRLSEHWHSDSKEEMDIHLLAGRIDLGACQLMLASANHIAPQLFRADGRPALIRLAPGPSLSRGNGGHWPVWQTALNSMDRLVVASRSVLDHQDENGRRFSDTQLALMCAQHSSESAPSQVAAVLDAVNRNVGTASGSEDLAALIFVLQERE